MEKSENMRKLAHEIKVLRAKNNMTQEDLAKASGVSNCAIVFIENCRTQARAKTLIKLARALHVDESELLIYIL